MKKINNTLQKRRFFLILGVFSMLFAGIIYAWSILKAPLAEEFSWDSSALAMNFTLTMCAFCLGGFGGSFLSRKIGAQELRQVLALRLPVCSPAEALFCST